MSDTKPRPPSSALALIASALSPLLWAGVSLGGNLVAAPAKFQVPNLDLSLALQVGRVQFGWIAWTEWILLAAIIVACIAIRRFPSKPLLAAVVIFLLQQFWLDPLLESRSDIVLAGGDPGESHWHLVYVATEGMKFVLLLVAGWFGVIRNQKG